MGRPKPFSGHTVYVKYHPERSRPSGASGIKERIERLHETVMELPRKLFQDSFSVLTLSQMKYRQAG